MLFKLINVSNLEWDKAVDFEADSIDAACEYVLKNAYKFSNWHIFRDDTVQLCYKTVDGGWFIAAFIDLHKNEVVTKLYDGRRAPEPYVETAEQGELADVENNTASEQDNTVENTSVSDQYNTVENTSASELDSMLINVPAKLVNFLLFIFVVVASLHIFSIAT